MAEPDPKTALLAAETSAWEGARPVLMAHCAACHTRGGKKAAKKKLAHFALDTYPLGGHHARTIGFTIREVLGLTGKKPTMPYDKPGAVRGDELAAIKAWTDAWEAAETAGVHSPAPAGEHG
jgi:mono/diheme cytochrome c family protein